MGELTQVLMRVQERHLVRLELEELVARSEQAIARSQAILDSTRSLVRQPSAADQP